MPLDLAGYALEDCLRSKLDEHLDHSVDYVLVEHHGQVAIQTHEDGVIQTHALFCRRIEQKKQRPRDELASMPTKFGVDRCHIAAGSLFGFLGSNPPPGFAFYGRISSNEFGTYRNMERALEKLCPGSQALFVLRYHDERQSDPCEITVYADSGNGILTFCLENEIPQALGEFSPGKKRTFSEMALVTITNSSENGHYLSASIESKRFMSRNAPLSPSSRNLILDMHATLKGQGSRLREIGTSPSGLNLDKFIISLDARLTSKAGVGESVQRTFWGALKVCLKEMKGLSIFANQMPFYRDLLVYIQNSEYPLEGEFGLLHRAPLETLKTIVAKNEAIFQESYDFENCNDRINTSLERLHQSFQSIRRSSFTERLLGECRLETSGAQKHARDNTENDAEFLFTDSVKRQRCATEIEI